MLSRCENCSRLGGTETKSPLIREVYIYIYIYIYIWDENLVIVVPTDVLAPNVPKSLAGTVLTTKLYVFT